MNTNGKTNGTPNFNGHWVVIDGHRACDIVKEAVRRGWAHYPPPPPPPAMPVVGPDTQYISVEDHKKILHMANMRVAKAQKRIRGLEKLLGGLENSQKGAAAAS